MIYHIKYDICTEIKTLYLFEPVCTCLFLFLNFFEFLPSYLSGKKYIKNNKEML